MNKFSRAISLAFYCWVLTSGTGHGQVPESAEEIDPQNIAAPGPLESFSAQSPGLLIDRQRSLALPVNNNTEVVNQKIADAIAELMEVRQDELVGQIRNLDQINGLVVQLISNKLRQINQTIDELDDRVPTRTVREQLKNDIDEFDHLANLRVEIAVAKANLASQKNVDLSKLIQQTGKLIEPKVVPALPQGAVEPGRNPPADTDQARQLPFFSVPVPFALPDQNSLERMRSQSGFGPKEKIPLPERIERQTHHVFTGPATFSVMAYDQHEQPVVERQVMIFEGMRVSFDRDGNYEIQFLVESPAMPVSLRLQLRMNRSLAAKEGNTVFEPLNSTDFQNVTLTLPLIAIEPSSISPDRPGVYVVRHQGHSIALKSWNGSDLALNVTRHGTATIGFPSTKYIDDYHAERILRPQLANPWSDAILNGYNVGRK